MDANLNLYLVTGRVEYFEYMEDQRYSNEMRLVWAIDSEHAEFIFADEFETKNSTTNWNSIKSHKALYPKK